MAFTVLSTELESDERSGVFSQPKLERELLSDFRLTKSLDRSQTVVLIYGEVSVPLHKLRVGAVRSGSVLFGSVQPS